MRASNNGTPPAGADGSGGAGDTARIGGAVEGGQDWSALSGMAPVYVEMVNEISGDIKTVESKMAELRAAHEARVRCVVGASGGIAREIVMVPSS